MNAAEFKKAFVQKTSAAFAEGVLCGNGKTWARGMTAVLSDMGRMAGQEVCLSKPKGDMPDFCICADGDEKTIPQVFIAHAIWKKEYCADGTWALVEKCASTPASLRVAIGYAKTPEDALRDGESLTEKFIGRENNMSPNSELLLIIGWRFAADVGWHTWLLPRSAAWHCELAAATPAEKLANYIRQLSDFESHAPEPYTSMADIIIDGVLQRGMKYDVVWGRVRRFRRECPGISTVQQFSAEIKERSVSDLLNWKESDKTRTIRVLTDFLVQKKIDVRSDFYYWLANDQNVAELKSIKGIGDKTADYFKLLTGHENTSAVDTHVANFVTGKAEIALTGRVPRYEEIREMVKDAADILGKSARELDHSIWRYMAKADKKGRQAAVPVLCWISPDA